MTIERQPSVSVLLPVLSLGMYLFMEAVTVAASRGVRNPSYAAALADFCLALLNGNEFVYLK